MASKSRSPAMQIQLLEAFDPLEPDPKVDTGLLIAAQRREIANILKCYTGYFDLFGELLQNALDAVERRLAIEPKGYKPQIWVIIDLKEELVSVTDNGAGMILPEFKSFLCPNYSFKDGAKTRGCKGVGATYLAYGFNELHVATRTPSGTYSGVIRNGRTWLDDKNQTVSRPKVTNDEVDHQPFASLDRGTSMTVRLDGDNVRPKDLSFVGATTATQWMALQRILSPLGGIYLCGDVAPPVKITVTVVPGGNADATECSIDAPEYVYPHQVMGRTVDLRVYLKDLASRAASGKDPARIPPNYTQLNGLWGEWTGEEILAGTSPINIRLEEGEKDLINAIGIKLYIFLGYSTELWDEYNDITLKLRRGYRALRGGLQLATRHMPQGLPLTIPLTNNIGFQNLVHVIVHFDNAEPDLGRKGFQPEVVKIAEKISVSGVTAFRKYYPRMLRKRTGAPALAREMNLERWIDDQKQHEKDHPLVLKGKGLFLPTEQLPIRSTPLVEQDVVAMFNQMLSSGVVRGIQILSSSQYNQYDGLFRFVFDEPLEKYLNSNENPLGIEQAHLTGVNPPVYMPVKILEYKHNLDDLIEEFQTEEKRSDEIALVVVWDSGTRWKAAFDVTSYLDPAHTHLRQFHGLTHLFSHSASGVPAFEAIVLHDLVRYLTDAESEIVRQRQLYTDRD